MATGKKTFIFYSDWTNMINEMPDKDAGQLLKHVLSYVNDKNPITDNILVKMAFGHMKPILKSDLDKWENQLEKYSEMGKKSAEKRANKKAQPRLTQVEPTSTVNDNVNVNEKEEKNNTATPFSFMRSLIQLGGKEELVKDWLKVRKTKKLTNTETAFNGFVKELGKSNKSINEVLTTCCENSWAGFKSSWKEKEINGSEQKPTIETWGKKS